MIKKPRFLFCLLAITIAAGAAAFAQDAFSGSAEDIVIRSIEISGNYEVSDETILAAISSKIGEPLSTKKLEDDLLSVFNLGLFSEDVRASLDEYQDGAKIVFTVVENPVLDKIIMEGNKEISNSEILDLIETRESTILNSNQLKEDVKKIENAYMDKGYRAARVLDVGVDNERNLRIIISEGMIQSIRIAYIKVDEDSETEEREESTEGKTKDYVVFREMRVKPGDVFNAADFQKDLQKIFNLGYFEDISTRYEPGDKPGNIIVVIEVQEGRTGQIGFGAGYSNTSGFVGNLSYSERNLQGKGRRLDARLEAGGKRTNYELGYFEPWMTKSQMSGEANFFRTTQTDLRYGLGGIVVPDYEERHTGFRLTLGQPISFYTKVFVGFKHDQVDVTPDNTAVTTGLDGLSRSVTFTVRTDTRDNIFDTTTGRFDTASWEVNGHMVGGDFDYHKINFDLRRYRPIRKKQVLAARLMVGLGKDAIPRFDWFDIGGVNTLRGYDEYQFSGTKFLLINGEYRFGLSGNFSAVLFADVGNTWLDVSDMSLAPDDLNKSAGIGLRFKIPALGMGPLRLDYAWAFSTDETKLEFGFGHMF